MVVSVEKRKILVLGGSGFVGSHLIPALLVNGYDVSVLNRGTKLMPGTHQLTADREVKEQLGAVVGVVTHFDAVIDTSSYTLQHTACAWEAFGDKTEHWIHLSSAAVYREIEGRLPEENDGIGGAAAWKQYGIEKSQADRLLIENAGDTAVTILRPPYLYGSGNNNDRETFVWARALQLRPVILPGDGTTKIQFLHIDDLANVFIAAVQHIPKRLAIYNVAGEEQPTLEEWVAITAAAAGLAYPGALARRSSAGYAPREYFPFRDIPCAVQCERVKKALGWEQHYTLRDGLALTFAEADKRELIQKRLDTKVEDKILARMAAES